MERPGPPEAKGTALCGPGGYARTAPVWPAILLYKRPASARRNAAAGLCLCGWIYVNIRMRHALILFGAVHSPCKPARFGAGFFSRFFGTARFFRSRRPDPAAFFFLHKKSTRF